MQKYDRVYIRGALHHFNRSRLTDTLLGLLNKLKIGGKLLIEKPADTFNCLPYPTEVIDLMNGMEPSREDTIKLLQDAGYVLLESHRHQFAVVKEKAELFETFRKRLCSGFSMFSDAEIEEGIKEVDQKYPGGKIMYVDERDFIVGCNLKLDL